MKTDIMFLGPITNDCNIDYDGTEVRSIGGAVTFCAPAAKAAGANVYVSLKANPADTALLETFPLPKTEWTILPSPETTLMRNVYFTPDRERRRGTCLAQSDPITCDQVPEMDCTLYHLAGLLYGDFPSQLMRTLSQRGQLALDVQGVLRHNEGGTMVFHDWAEKRTLLPCITYLKADAAEAELLTGTSDLQEAARILHSWGAGEILISHNAQMLCWDGSRFSTCPVRSRNLSGRTGRGDTVFGAYLGMRVQGYSMEESLRYATACVSLKMETPGPFAGSRADVETYLQEFYRDCPLPERSST